MVGGLGRDREPGGDRAGGQAEREQAVCLLFPGDLIFTGTPGGVGNRREPPRFLGPGDQLVSTAEGLGRMHHRFDR